MSDVSPDPIVSGSQYAAIEITIQPGVLGQDSQIDAATLKLTGMAEKIADAISLVPGVKEMSPQAYGTFFHRQFAAAVRAAGLAGIADNDVETTFGGARYGEKGSV